MDQTLWLVLGLAAAGLGMGAAQASGPVACTWPAPTSAALVHRVEALCQRLPGPRRRVAGSLAILILIVGGCTAAYVAAPPAPRALARQAVAAVIATALGQPAPPAPVLATAATALTGPFMPPGGVGGPVPVNTATPLPQLDLAKATASELLAYQHTVNTSTMTAPLNGLTMEQTQRFFALSQKMETRKINIRMGLAPPVPFFADDMAMPSAELVLAALGPDAAEYNRYLGVIDAGATGPQRAEVAANPLTGPDHFYLPAGADRAATMRQDGVDPRGSWLSSLPDAQGGVTLTRVSVSAGIQQGRNLAQVQAALREADDIDHGADPSQYGMSAAGAAAVMATMPRSVRAALGR